MLVPDATLTGAGTLVNSIAQKYDWGKNEEKMPCLKKSVFSGKASFYIKYVFYAIGKHKQYCHHVLDPPKEY